MTASSNTKPSGTGTPHPDMDPATPHVRQAPPMTPDYDQLNDKKDQAESRQEALIDEAVEESFPASDPASPKQIT